MKSTLIFGVVLAVLAGVAVLLGDLLVLDLRNVILGAGIGAVLGSIPERSPILRIAGFLIGIVIAWVAYAVRATLLPVSVWSVVIVAVGTVLLLTVVAVVSAGRIPLWTLLLGAVGMIGAYEWSFLDSPTDFINQSLAAMASLILTAGVGVVAAVAAAAAVGARGEPDLQPDARPVSMSKTEA